MVQTNDLPEVQNDILGNPLLLFDQLLGQCKLEELTHGQQKRIKKQILRCILSIAGLTDNALNCADDEVEDKAKESLDKHFEMHNKDIVTACYLRLMAFDQMDWVCLPPWRPKVIGFLEAQLNNDITKDLKIYPHSQAHEITPILIDAVLKQEIALENAIQTLTSLDQHQNNRNRLMATLNSRLGRVILRPFLPDNLDHHIGDLYLSIENYLKQRESLGIIDAHSDAVASITDFKKLLNSFGTAYSIKIGDSLGNKLLDLIEYDFSNNKASQPAKVTLETRAKKYPLHLVGNEINISFIVKNHGPGYAYNTHVEVICDETVLRILTPDIDLGRFPPSQSQNIKVPATILAMSENVDVLATIKWQNYTGEELCDDIQSSIKAQRSDIDWLKLKYQDPYSLEPVTTIKELVGRKEVLNRLLASLKASTVGSSIIHGQKRVGKTSIAKTLQSHLENDAFLTIYLEAGDYVEPAATATINRLGIKLCQKIREAEPRISTLPVPTFDQALSPLTDFLDAVINIIPEKRIAILLDEFDELPLELYTRGPWGDSFFLTLRSITSRSNIGFILVGGEKMAHIMDCQGDNLNKWSVVPVDYFSRETDWSDYVELVQRPVQDFLEYTDDALLNLHELTAGNPYFTKLICQQIFRNAVSNRDCYITQSEVDFALSKAVIETGRNTFQHFWEDGIFESGEKATEKSIRRRKILISISDLLQKQTPVPGKVIRDHPLINDLPTLVSDLKDFVSRKILVAKTESSLSNDNYDFKVKFFSLWLKDRGVHDVIATFADLDAALEERQQKEQLKVTPQEVVELVKKWSFFKGQQINEDKVRAWLGQFYDVQEQRAMYKILNGIHFYSNKYIRNKLAEVHDLVVRGVIRTIGIRQQKRGDILVSYLDSPGKSGATFANLYADEAQIYTNNVIEKSKLAEMIQKKENLNAVVFIDDFVGTGHQASENLKTLNDTLREVVRDQELKIVFIAIIAVKEGWEFLNNNISNLEIHIETHYCECIDETARYFSDNSSIFTDIKDREYAKDVAARYGKLLVKNNPLGFGNLGLGVVFEHSIPNDSLPILWAESSAPKWTPLFKRL